MDKKLWSTGENTLIIRSAIYEARNLSIISPKTEVPLKVTLRSISWLSQKMASCKLQTCFSQAAYASYRCKMQ